MSSVLLNPFQGANAAFNELSQKTTQGVSSAFNGLCQKADAGAASLYDGLCKKGGVYGSKLNNVTTKFKAEHPYLMTVAKKTALLGLAYLIFLNATHAVMGGISEHVLHEPAGYATSAAKAFWENRSTPSKIALGLSATAVAYTALSFFTFSTLVAATAFNLGWQISAHVTPDRLR